MGISILLGEKTSCFSANVSIKTTEGAHFSKMSIRRCSDSSKINVVDASDCCGLPSKADVRAAAELFYRTGIFRLTVVTALLGLPAKLFYPSEAKQRSVECYFQKRTRYRDFERRAVSNLSTVEDISSLPP
jgi:hypothetical protein